MNCGVSKNDDDDYTMVTDYSYDDTYGGETYSSRTCKTYRTYGSYESRRNGSLGALGECFGCSGPKAHKNYYENDQTLMTRESIDFREDISYAPKKSTPERSYSQRYEKTPISSYTDTNYRDEPPRRSDSLEDEIPMFRNSSLTYSATDKYERTQHRSHADEGIDNATRMQKALQPHHLSKSNLPKTSLADEISVLTKEIEDPSQAGTRNGNFKNLTLRVPSPTELSSLTQNITHQFSPNSRNTTASSKNTNYFHSPMHQYSSYQGERDNACVEHREEIDPYIEDIEARRRSVSNFSSLPQKPPISNSAENVKQKTHSRHNSNSSNSSAGKIPMFSHDILHAGSATSTVSRVRVVDAYGTVDKTELEQYDVPPGEMGVKLRSTKEGVMITRKAYNSICPQLSVGDIIIALDGVDISTFSAKAVKKLLDARETQPVRSIIYKPGFISQQSQQTDQSYNDSSARISQYHNPNTPSQSVRSNEYQVPFNGYPFNAGTSSTGSYSLNINKQNVPSDSHSQLERSNEMNYHPNTFSRQGSINFPNNSPGQNSMRNRQFS